MPGRDGKGPRKRSPKPSERMGGLKNGGCKNTKSQGQGRK